MTPIVIELNHVSKDFDLQNQKTFKEFVPALIRGEQTRQKFTALSDINFSVSKGETIGIIGPNGSGKSTILKLIAKVMVPTSGKIAVHGQVSPLIELGAGMHPELTGRENIYLNGSILGLNQRQIDQNFNHILDFSEIHDFIDQPVKHYSSGMYLRLAFSIAVHVNPEILLIDEILAVGDQEFQQKCLRKMEEFKKNQTTIVFVSHSLNLIKKFCTRVIHLDHSQIIAIGQPTSICQRYLKSTQTVSN